jgi:hypothetical protein
MGEAVTESDGGRQGWLALGRPRYLGVVLEGASRRYPAPGDRSASVFAGVERVSPSVGDQPADLAQSVEGGV